MDYHRQRAIIISSTTTVDRSVYPYKSAEAIETAKERKFALFAADRLTTFRNHSRALPAENFQDRQQLSSGFLDRPS